MDLGERLRAIGKEHRAELAHHRVEGRVAERQLHRVGLAPGDGTRDRMLRRLIEHRLVQVRGDDRDRLRQRGGERARDDAGSGGDLEHILHVARREPQRKVGGVRLEEERDEMRLVDFGDGSGEDLVGVVRAHGVESSFI